jgi:hypothetical protein
LHFCSEIRRDSAKRKLRNEPEESTLEEESESSTGEGQRRSAKKGKLNLLYCGSLYY